MSQVGSIICLLKDDGQDQKTRQRNGGLSGVHKHSKQEKLDLLLSLVAAGRKLDPENLRLAVDLIETVIRHPQMRKTNGP